MRYTIKIQCDNAAFRDNPALEVSGILKTLLRSFDILGLAELALHDSNGNTVGKATIS